MGHKSGVESEQKPICTSRKTKIAGNFHWLFALVCDLFCFVDQCFDKSVQIWDNQNVRPKGTYGIFTHQNFYNKLNYWILRGIKTSNTVS